MYQAVNRYYETQIKTATPEELTLMLYNGCLRFLKQAKTCIENKDYENKNINIIKALDIIDELQSTLDMNYEISKNLWSLYDYFKTSLVSANIRLDVIELQKISDMIMELRDTWQEAIKLVKQK
ncbi:flagellar export chaperone FliS [Paenibacillus barengoltzii]|uniref:Flagellar protein FliS n=1 Tax=Paenibacillus barengoltzii J12 TaxID=935846 RepID=A0ABY1LSH4_9BACL|nr:flagellar export chaperone FliS [Paenibacillus barengoltzii]SME94906.1 flagellar protein FliS [Paenibacillus barengoltzii J12]